MASKLIRIAQRTLATGNGQKFTLPAMPYDYNALEPALTGQIMETHHLKHHQTYVNNLNNAMVQLNEAQHKQDLEAIIRLQPALRFNGGGHVNHSIFWTNLAPVHQGGGQPPKNGTTLSTAIAHDFKSFDNLKQVMTTAGLGVQGSGWVWLGYNAKTQCLEVTTRPNQDPLVEIVPLLGIDVWEHAYYYKYGPARAEYLKNIWSVINWQNVEERLVKACQQS